MSGGRDSLALLHATAHQARELGLRVAALHVHHGLQPAADEWAAHVRRSCEAWASEGLPVLGLQRRLGGKPARGESVEAWARRARYAALAEMAHEAGADLVLLAHHREDQAETVLLQALRGGGPAGLAAMPRLATRKGLTWARPWLGQPRAAIEAYVAAHRLRYVDDESNAQTRHARNRLRHLAMPALRAAFPQADAALAAVAARAAETRALIDTLVARQLPLLRDADALNVQAWLQQPPPWRTALLRAWMRGVLEGGVPESLVDRLALELPGAGSARWPAPGGELRCHRGRLRFAGLAPSRQGSSELAPGENDPPLAPGRHALPRWRATLVVESAGDGGIDLALLAGAGWRARQGGEQFQRAVGTPPRSLKKQFQAAGVPAWMRDAPLLWSADARLLFVPGLGTDVRALATPGAPQLRLRWLPWGSGETVAAD